MHDSIVPARFDEALHHTLHGPKQLKTVEAAEHDDWIEHVDESGWREATGFLLLPSQQ